MRVIARIDVKNEFVIKGINLEGLRKVGDPNELAVQYYSQGIDEIVFMDVVASLYGRNNLYHIIEKATDDVFVPITVGGGIRTVKDIQRALNAGADKVAINTEAIKNPEFIKEASNMYGSQCIIGSIEAKRKGDKWEAYVDSGREKTGIDAVEWAERLVQLGIGEILLTSIDHGGTKIGFDSDLIKKILRAVSVPVIASGGMGEIGHVSELCKQVKPSAIALASVLHYRLISINTIKEKIADNSHEVRI